MNRSKLYLLNSGILLLFIVYSLTAFSQNITKAKIKKPKINLFGEWSVSMMECKGKKELLRSVYSYNFMANGTYHYQHHWTKGPVKYHIYYWTLEDSGKWKLNKTNDTLTLISDSLSNNRLEPYDLAVTQYFEQTKPGTFKIRRISGIDTVDYTYLRRQPRSKRKDFK